MSEISARPDPRALEAELAAEVPTDEVTRALEAIRGDIERTLDDIDAALGGARDGEHPGA